MTSMEAFQTHKVGRATGRRVGSRSSLSISGKNPQYDYSFKLASSILDIGCDQNGWIPVGEGNYSGETWEIPFMKTLQAQTKGSFKQIKYIDTILCRRSKEVSAGFKREEDERYNQQIRLVRESAKNAHVKLRQLDDNASVTGNISQSGKPMQMRGETQDA